MVFCGIPVADIIDPKTGRPLALPRCTYAMAVDRLGMRLVKAEYDVVLDADGNPQLDEKGNEVRENVRMPAYDLSEVVKVEGYTDCYGTPIPKGRQYFVADRESANRQPTESNVKDLGTRLPRWVLTGEGLIKDESGSGQNEQHRLWAVAFDRLSGRNLAPENGIPVITIDGVSTGAAGAIDSGKQKSATDDLSSNHEVLPFPLTRQDYLSGTDIGYGADQKQARVKILRDLQSVAKRIVLRMTGKNIKASVFTGHDSGGYANLVCSQWRGLDEVVNMVYAFVVNIPMKDEAKRVKRPVKTWEVATAYALYLLRDCPQLQGVESLEEYAFPSVNLAELQNFLTDIESGVDGSGPLADWCRVRVTSERLKDSDESSFAQVLLAMKAYFGGDLPVDPSFCLGGTKGVTGKDNQNSGAKFTHFGGGDRGPLPKKVKASE
jgi:hypothetical protein